MRMPVLFVGHGNPMNAILDNAFTQSLTQLGKEIPLPKAIVCISAHWMTEGAWVTHMQRPRTIHDFYGFPQALFDVQYPCPGDQKLADSVIASVHSTHLHPDDDIWGIDHGTWSVLRHMYPMADIPVIQLSLYMAKPHEYHFRLGQDLAQLRDQGVLIVGSGNVVHNLHKIDIKPGAKPFDWALEFDDWLKKRIESREFSQLTVDALKLSSGRLSIPSMDHWYPLLYVLGASDKKDNLHFEYQGIEHASISMRCMSFGLR